MYHKLCGILLTSLFTDNAMLMAYAARIINMIVAMVLLYFAIKLMPFGKIGMLMSMCFPIAVEGFTSMSPDAITIRSSLFIYSICIKYGF